VKAVILIVVGLGAVADTGLFLGTKRYDNFLRRKSCDVQKCNFPEGMCLRCAQRTIIVARVGGSTGKLARGL